MLEAEDPKKNPYVRKLFEEFPDARTLRGKWRSLFEQRGLSARAELILEIGSSNGKYLNSIAEKNPNRNFIGMDWKYKQVYKSFQDAHKKKLKNTSFLRADASDLDQTFAPGEIDEVWIFFPDPWPKFKQQKNRLLSEAFFLILAKLGVKRICIKTDHPGYFQWILAHWGKEILLNNASHPPTELGANKLDNHAKQTALRSYENKDLPKSSAQLADAFKVELITTDFWAANIQALLHAQNPQKLFFTESTLFETLFQKDGLPVYYLELSLNAGHS